MPARCSQALRVALAVLVALVAACGNPPKPTERTSEPSTQPVPATDGNDPVATGWVVTAASPILAPASSWDDEHEVWADGLDGSTLRQVVHSSIGGEAVRVTVSNRAGTE